MKYEFYRNDSNLSLFSKILKIDWFLLLLLLILLFCGCLALYSAAGGNWHPWAIRHLEKGIIGFVLAIFIAFTDIKIIYKYAWYPLILSILMLLILYLTSDGRVNRWLDLGFIKIQPSEFAKVSLILALSRFFHDVSINDHGKILYSFLAVIISTPIIFLTIVQPDLGTSIMQILLVAAMIYIAGLRVWMIILSFAGFLASMPIIWFQLHDYQKRRILTFLDPNQDALGAGYHITQSKIALGSGGIFGKGFLQGSQSHLNFLPEKQTDFIFTMLGEEFGLAGGLFIIMIFSLLILYGYIISFIQSSQFSRIMCVGIVFMIFSFVFVNIGMVSGIIPVVGAPLPLISYGGTSMLTTFIAFGLIMSASIHRNDRIDFKN